MTLDRLRGGQLLAAAALLVALAGITSGCGAVSGATAIGSATSQALTVYSSLPLQGPSAQRSQDVVDGEKLALEQSGGRAGRYRVGYVSMDDTSPSTGRWDPGQTSSNAKTAAQDRSTIAYLGDWDSGATAVSLPLINGSGILQLSPASSYTGFTRALYAAKGEPDRYYPAGRRSFARLVSDDGQQASALLAYMARLHVRRLYVISDREVFDAAVAPIVTAAAGARHVAVAGQDELGVSSSDDQAVLARAVQARPDAVLYAGSNDPHAAEMLLALHSRLKRLKVFLPYFAADPGFLGQLGSARAVTYVASPAAPVRSYPPAGQRFAADYLARFGAEPGAWAAYGYESMSLILDTIRVSGRHGNDRQTIINRVLATRDRDSVLGRYSFRTDATINPPTYEGYRVREGQLVFDRTLLAPRL